ncbi:GGDEF domain-containing protein [Stenotrophomonas lacuserhaii]|uniref:GGDEF domain-containing protein n=1 Tax=Stenotrophomonas lacuserhaii TaxID=2760084 RepID=UPI001CB73E59|nr:sensor domain-containing diguanylate cyclase [Stenotrophomonas lacuserhaii]
MADSNALVSLSQFARTASGADLAIVVEVQTDGRVAWSTGFPVTSFSGFNLARSGMLEHAWNDQPVDASRFRLPTSILTALGGPAGSVLFIPAPSDDAPSSGLLLLWKTGASPEQCAASMALLGPSVAQLLSARRGAVHDIVVRNQFIDLVESVPAGIVLVDGDGLGTVINQRAAELLGHKPGRHRAADLVAPMRALRQRCDNHEALEQAYAAQVGNLNFATTLHWVMGERTFEVDTHPVRGDGEQGRIWLFTDITADLLMAAELRRLASSDPLTGVPNRRHFEERSAQIIAAREATGRSVAVLMLDVDHFKKINDTHGHPIGDEVLKVVARRCREALRERDLFARFGGEEFIALLAAPTADEVPATAERLRNAISGAPVHVGGLRVEVTVSVGGAMGEALPGSDARLLEQLVARADEALYQAKADGRNRVRMSG